MTLTAADRAGHAVSDAVSFTIDTVPPTTTLTLGNRSNVTPASLPLVPVLHASDADGAAGGVVHEDVMIDGCRVYDGDTFGDRDGLLSDETIVIDKDELCRIFRSCGFNRLQAPAMTYEASDCGHNVGRVTKTLFRNTIPIQSVCAPEVRRGQPSTIRRRSESH